jgi:hypothetical protein
LRHTDAGADGLLRVSNTNDFDLFADFDNPRSTRPVTTVPRPEMEEHVFHGHRGTVHGALWHRDVGVQRQPAS